MQNEGEARGFIYFMPFWCSREVALALLVEHTLIQKMLQRMGKANGQAIW